MARIIGLTGKRSVGKSEIASYFVREKGYVKIHSFGQGLAMAEAYFLRLSGDPEMAKRMVYSDLKDVPSNLLPMRSTPRLFLERLGAFMPRELGVGWTLGVEVEKAIKENPGVPIVVESVVYEADFLRAIGGKIIRVIRPGFTSPVGEKTDAAQELIEADVEVRNVGSLDNLFDAVEWAINWIDSGEQY